MTIDNFLSFLQQLLTMVDPQNEESIRLGRDALRSTVQLAISSHKVDAYTLRAMLIAKHNYERLVIHADEFTGIPGEYELNEKRRRRLRMAIEPHC